MPPSSWLAYLPREEPADHITFGEACGKFRMLELGQMVSYSALAQSLYSKQCWPS